MMSPRSCIPALIAALFFSAGGHAASAASAAPPASELSLPNVDSKVVWGQLLNMREASAFGCFSDWLGHKLAANHDEQALQALMARSVNGAIVPLGAYLTSKDSIHAAASPNIGQGAPKTPIRVDGEGENYQGINVALVSVDAGGRPTDFRSLPDRLRAGERFKLRVTSTFDAVVVLDKISPEGLRSQIYPAKTGLAAVIPAGMEILLPLGQKEYLLHTGTHSGERFAFTIRDPRSLEAGLAATMPVFRKDDRFGSNFIQEMQPNRYPVIAEAIRLEYPTAPAP